MTDISKAKKERKQKRELCRKLSKNGMVYREIAVFLNISVGAVHNYINNEEKVKKLKKTKTQKKPHDKKSAKIRMLKSRYGISFNQYVEMYEKQNKRCRICLLEKKLGGRSGLYVDHCHQTGVVRGLLCPSCNSAIGLLKENPEILINAMSYLKLT